MFSKDFSAGFQNFSGDQQFLVIKAGYPCLSSAKGELTAVRDRVVALWHISSLSVIKTSTPSVDGGFIPCSTA